MVKTKRCTKCDRRRSADSFCGDRSREDGLFPWCKSCHRESSARRRAGLSKEELSKRSSAQRAKRDANKTLREHYLAYQTVYGLETRYGITPQELVAMADRQGRACAICKTRFPRPSSGAPTGRGRLNIDHDHATGKVRGLLCGSCNTGLGNFKDNIEFLMAAITYLEQHAIVVSRAKSK